MHTSQQVKTPAHVNKGGKPEPQSQLSISRRRSKVFDRSLKLPYLLCLTPLWIFRNAQQRNEVGILNQRLHVMNHNNNNNNNVNMRPKQQQKRLALNVFVRVKLMKKDV
jgi:hypothetical protein